MRREPQNTMATTYCFRGTKFIKPPVSPDGYHGSFMTECSLMPHHYLEWRGKPYGPKAVIVCGACHGLCFKSAVREAWYRRASQTVDEWTKHLGPFTREIKLPKEVKPRAEQDTVVDVVICQNEKCGTYNVIYATKGPSGDSFLRNVSLGVDIDSFKEGKGLGRETKTALESIHGEFSNIDSIGVEHIGSTDNQGRAIFNQHGGRMFPRASNGHSFTYYFYTDEDGRSIMRISDGAKLADSVTPPKPISVALEKSDRSDSHGRGWDLEPF